MAKNTDRAASNPMNPAPVPPDGQKGGWAVMLGVFGVPIAVIVAIMLLKWLFEI